MKRNNVIELSHYRRPVPASRRRRRRSAAASRFFSAAFDALCYLVLLTCLIIGAGALAMIV